VSIQSSATPISQTHRTHPTAITQLYALIFQSQTYGAEPVDGFYPLKSIDSSELSFSTKTEDCSIPSIFLKK
jgi:hypothetical protein